MHGTPGLKSMFACCNGCCLEAIISGESVFFFGDRNFVNNYFVEYFVVQFAEE